MVEKVAEMPSFLLKIFSGFSFKIVILKKIVKMCYNIIIMIKNRKTPFFSEFTPQGLLVIGLIGLAIGVVVIGGIILFVMVLGNG